MSALSTFVDNVFNGTYIVIREVTECVGLEDQLLLISAHII